MKIIFLKLNIHNYLAVLSLLYITLTPRLFNISTYIVFHKTIKINRPLHPKAHTYIDIHLLTSLVLLCDAFQDALIYKTLLMVADFSFLRLSNLLPHSRIF